MISSHTPAIRRLARRAARSREEMEDLAAVGELAAWIHPEKPIQHARSAMAHYRRDYGAMIRIPGHAQGRTFIPVHPLRGDPPAAVRRSVEEEALERIRFSRALRALTPKQRRAAIALGEGGTWADAMRSAGTTTNATGEYRRNMRRRLEALGYSSVSVSDT